MTDLLIARSFHWKYEWVAELPRDVYALIVADLQK
jgi:hypothetical protein